MCSGDLFPDGRRMFYGAPQVRAPPGVVAHVGEVISLAERRWQRTPGGAGEGAPRASRVTFSFDLASPFTYLAAERVDRLFPGVAWRPVLEDAMHVAPADPSEAEARARALGLPLVWPDGGRAHARPAMRVAALAAEQGCAAPFVLAASRLAFCGGFELDHPEALAEAAAAAGLGLDEALRAAGDPRRDARMVADARKLVAQGADRLPALRVNRLLFAGEDRMGAALMALHAPASQVVG
jgi:2-hydroxychromene-2-carboxylate isomerase